MARHDEQRPRVPLNEEAPPPADQAAAEPKERRVAIKARQCPICYEGALNGVGVAYNTQHNKRYYKCPECGHTWVATIKSEVTKIEHRETELDER